MKSSQNLDDVIRRLMEENSQDKRTLQKIEQILSQDPEFYGLSIVGGVQAIYRRYLEEKAKNNKLSK